MSISYKSLLPKIMQSTRWGQFIDAFQNVIDEIVTNVVKPIKTRFQYNLMTQTELLDMAARLGYTITYLDGYTSSTLYFKKEILSIIPRIYAKTTRTGYKYIYKIFNLLGDVYPIYYTLSGNKYIFQVQDKYWTTAIGRNGTYQILDNSPALYLDKTLLILDNTLSVTVIPIRHFVLSYYNTFIEDSTQFLSVNTLQAFYNDVQVMKRATELPYFEPVLNFNLYSGHVGQTTITPWTDYNLNTYNNQQYILFTSNLSGIASVQLGKGTYSNLSYATGGVQTLQYTIQNNTSGMQYLDPYTAVKFHARKMITEKFKFQNTSSGQLYFTEIAFLNSNSGCIAYSTFPKIQWYPYMNQGICVNVNLV